MSSGSAKPWEHAKTGPGSAADPLAARFVQSLDHDRRLYKQDITGSIVHARMLAKVGLISHDEFAQIEKSLKEIEAEIEADFDGWPGWKVELEDVHMCIEAALIEKIGDAGRKLHTGRSRNDQVALDLKLWIAEAVSKGLRPKFRALDKALLNLAERDGRIVMPGYTHLQRAQPIVVGAELAAWASAFAGCHDRLIALHQLDCQNPLGSGAIAGSSLPLDRQFAARDLPAGEPTTNSIIATASRDAAIDFVYALAMTAMTLSRWAEQWIIYASSEFGFIALDERYTTGSSMMPQKRNPDMLELIRGRCGGVYGNLVALLTICKGLSIGYSRDLQEDKRHVFAAYDTVCDALAMAARMVSTTGFNADRIAAGLDHGFLDATSLTEYLVTRGVPFRTAHQVVAALVRNCESEGKTRLGDLALDQFNAACAQEGLAQDICDKDIYDWLGAQNVVKRYRSPGNAGLSGFEQQLKTWQAGLR